MYDYVNNQPQIMITSVMCSHMILYFHGFIRQGKGNKVLLKGLKPGKFYTLYFNHLPSNLTHLHLPSIHTFTLYALHAITLILYSYLYPSPLPLPLSRSLYLYLCLSLYPQSEIGVKQHCGYTAHAFQPIRIESDYKPIIIESITYLSSFFLPFILTQPLSLPLAFTFILTQPLTLALPFTFTLTFRLK